MSISPVAAEVISETTPPCSPGFEEANFHVNPSEMPSSAHDAGP